MADFTSGESGAAAFRAIRDAERDDIAALYALERACFDQDAQTRRSLAWLVCRSHARCRVVPGIDDTIAAYAVLLFRRGSVVARLYSIAVADAARGRGYGRALLADAEALAVAASLSTIRAEARWSNSGSRALFAAAGYRETERLPAYYPGPEDGIRLEKILRNA